MHHVIPREIDNSPRNKLTIPLCKTHHALIYCPEAKYGQHSIPTDGSLIVKHVLQSTVGTTIEFESMSGRTFFYTPESELLWD